MFLNTLSWRFSIVHGESQETKPAKQFTLRMTEIVKEYLAIFPKNIIVQRDCGITDDLSFTSKQV